MTAIQAVIVIGFVLIHVFVGKAPVAGHFRRSGWISLAGGISVAYVFVHILPELASAQSSVDDVELVAPWINYHAYFVALAGLVLFYGLEKIVKTSQQNRQQQAPKRGDTEAATHLGVFWLLVAVFAFYNGLIGYLLVHRESDNLQDLLLFSFAMALHFSINDYRLRMDHRELYHNQGRWLLVAAIVVGWSIGLMTEVAEVTAGMLFAFLAGGITLNVLKEELPEERNSRFLPFAIGSGGFGFLLLLL